MNILIISIIIGIVIGLVTVSIMKSQLRSVHRQSGASGYLDADSLRLHISRDQFLYQNVTRTPKPKSKK